MHILEISFHTCHFIDISASFTPHSDSEPCFISEPLCILLKSVYCYKLAAYHFSRKISF